MSSRLSKSYIQFRNGGGERWLKPLVKDQIAYVNSESGCGFITTEDTDQDVLFLRSSVKGSIPEVGEDVRFELVETQDGPRAREVRRT